MKPLKLALALLLATSIARPARANPGITGYSGKPYNGVSETCRTTCHSGGGAAPGLTIDVPSALKAGETGQVSIAVNGSLARTSLNAALSDGVKATAGQNTTIPFPTQTPGEVGAVVPPPSGASATYRFSFVAPNRNGTITLWVAGMAASGNGSGGDGVATATRTITVSGATASADDGGAPPDESSSGGSTSGGSTSGGSTSGGKRADGGGSSSSGSDDAEDDESASSDARGRRLSTQDSGGCAATPTTAVDAGAMACAALVALAFARRRRRA